MIATFGFDAARSGAGIRHALRLLACATAMALPALAIPPAARSETPWLALAEGTEVRHGDWYIRLGGAGGIYQLPDWRGTLAAFNVITTTTKQFEVQPFGTDAAMANAGIAIGWYLPSASLPAWAGADARIELSAAYIGAWRTQTRSAPFSGANLAAFTTLDGRVATSAAITGTHTVAERLRLALDGFESGLRLATDHRFGGILVSTSVGVFGGWAEHRYDYTAAVNPAAGGTAFLQTIDEKLGVTRVGANFGLDGRIPLNEQFALLLGARAGFAWNRVRLDGNDCGRASAANAAFVCSNAPGTFVAGSAYATTASDTRSRYGFVGSAMAALRWDLGFPIVTLGGFFTYDTAVPGVRNPAPPFVNAGNIITPGSGRTSIVFEEGYRAGGFLMVTIPFGSLAPR